MPHRRDESEAEYEEEVMEREVSWVVTVVRYLVSVVTFLIFISIVLGGYWLWEDFSPKGAPELNFVSAKASLRTHFAEFVEEVRSPCPLAQAETCKNK